MSGNGHSCPRASVRGGVGGGGRALRPCRLCVPISVRLCVPVSLCPCLICAHGSLHPRVPASRGPRASVSPPALHPRSPGSLHLCVLNPCVCVPAALGPFQPCVPAAPALDLCSPGSLSPLHLHIPAFLGPRASMSPPALQPRIPASLCPESLHPMHPCASVPASLGHFQPCVPAAPALDPCIPVTSAPPCLCIPASLGPFQP